MSREQIDKMPCRDKVLPYGDETAILEAFQQDGYVVITGILTPKEIQMVLDELWSSPRLLGKFNRHDPTSWADPSWPQQDGGRNFLSSTNIYKDAASWKLEANEKLVQTQQLLYGRKDIMMQDMGRWGVMRPALHHPEWRTDSSWLHWDQNPWTEPAFCRLQAVVCLTDSTATTGGFACVPGFHKEFVEWGESHPMGSLVVNGKVLDETYGKGQPFPVPENDACQARVVRVTAPAGSAVIWDSRLPHQNFPNTDAKAFRVVHYTMMQVKDDESVRNRRRLLGQKRILMDLLGKEGPCFPHNLSPTGRLVQCLDEEETPLDAALEEFGVTDAGKLGEAAKLVREAGGLEEQGRTSSAIKKHQRSMFLFPDIEEWHAAIFG